MRVSKSADRYAQLLARSGTPVTTRDGGTSYSGTGGDLVVLWSTFKQALREPADEPFRHDGATRRVHHELLQFEASAMGNVELTFEHQWVWTEYGDRLGFALWVTFAGDPALSRLGTVVQEDREGDDSVDAWVADVERSEAMRAVAGRQPVSFGFGLDTVG